MTDRPAEWKAKQQRKDAAMLANMPKVEALTFDTWLPTLREASEEIAGWVERQRDRGVSIGQVMCVLATYDAGKVSVEGVLGLPDIDPKTQKVI